MLVQGNRTALPVASIVPAAAGALAIVAAGTLPALCPFRVASGHACPLCGMTRAVRSLAAGDVELAIRYHPLVLLLAIELAVVGVFFARTRRRPSGALARGLVLLNLAALAITWLVRWRLGSLAFVVG